LKAELEKAWLMLDAANEKEQRGRETIETLKVEIDNLTKLVEQNSAMVVGSGNSIQEIMRQKAELTGERDNLITQANEMREKMAKSDELIIQMEKDTAKAFQQIGDLKQDMQARHNEIAKEQRHKAKLEKDLKNMQNELENKQNETKSLSNTLSKKKEENAEICTQIKEVRGTAERAQKENKVLDSRLTKIQNELQSQLNNNEMLSKEKQKVSDELKLREGEINKLKQQISRNNKMREAIQRKLQLSEEARLDLEQKRDAIKGKAIALEKDRNVALKMHEQDKKQVDELAREREILNKNLLKAAAATTQQLDAVRLHEQNKKNLEQEIASYREESGKQRKIIFQLEKEREKYINETSDLSNRIGVLMEDIKIKKMELFESQKKIMESEARLKQQQGLYEACRSDRNLYLKNLMESQDETTEMKRKLKIMTHQIDQFKEEISNKEAALVKVNLEHTRIEKEKESLRGELQRMKIAQADSRSTINGMEKEISNLQQVIREADTERKRQQKELEQVLTERDILGTQLVRRNDELALLHEKTKLQQSTLEKGEQHYKQRQDDIRVLRLELQKMRREKRLLLKTVAASEEVRRQVWSTQRELLREKTRCRALEEELENPMNIHRWRRLEGSDPSSYELIQQVHALQKRLIQKTEEVVAKEFVIKEKETHYLELREILARQPGPEAAEQLAEFQRCMRSKTKQLKRLAAELNMAETSMSEQESEIGRLNTELKECKQKYLELKKHELAQRKRQPSECISKPARTDGPRFTGGGFNLKQATRIEA